MTAQQINHNLPNTYDNKTHMFMWKDLASASLHFRKREMLKAFFITKLKPDLNDQIEDHSLSLF